MRYAGRRLADVLYLRDYGDTIQDRDFQILENLIVAKTYLINADHDVTDEICFVVHRYISRLVEKYGVPKITHLCPEFGAFYPRVKAAYTIIQGSRENRINRIEDYERLETEYAPYALHIHDILLHIPELSIYEPDLHALRVRVTLIRNLAIVASVAGIFGLIVSILSWVWPWADFIKFF